MAKKSSAQGIARKQYFRVAAGSYPAEPVVPKAVTATVDEAAADEANVAGAAEEAAATAAAEEAAATAAAAVTSVNEAVETVAQDRDNTGKTPYPGVPAAFHRIYESADGKMVLFQDSNGHLLAAQASRLV